MGIDDGPTGALDSERSHDCHRRRVQALAFRSTLDLRGVLALRNHQHHRLGSAVLNPPAQDHPTTVREDRNPLCVHRWSCPHCISNCAAGARSQNETYDRTTTWTRTLKGRRGRWPFSAGQVHVIEIEEERQ